jgi:Flp pilus assembly secretin CpaC
MTAPFHRNWRRRTRLQIYASVLTVAVLMIAPGEAAETITVFLDQAKIARLPDRVATIIIGNPLIADVTIQSGGLMVITGKGYGVTNLIALDRAGAVLREQSIQVQGPNGDVVVVYRGLARESYSCTPVCERRITLGDTPEFFDATLGETGARNNGAQGSAITPPQQQR